ncbi:putative tyrosyl-DNA phosphodiesterase [Triangularia verruculosa]|uniref:Tyrosyl-DNA phosphodiesterase n=1 Tax=Triangularia verruculosa TaxID=2587418 RepID=A0AAN6XBK6_9PEZI|nr:putative tyrosyl-DNA phosphodiesterase [Triangularia verruculosa]
MELTRKRPLEGYDGDGDEKPDNQQRSTPRSLTHPISPPLKKRRLPTTKTDTGSSTTSSPVEVIGSPFQLTKIKNLPAGLNEHTYTLNDILGDPLISECWEFNYLHDIDFLMSAFDEDVRSLVKVHVVHGFWKREDPNRLALQESVSRFSNVTLHAAFLPEMFGTHHSKMFILLRHDDTAQIIIHTANLITRDWANMTQAAWFSPRLPLLKPGQGQEEGQPRIGNGAKFKMDFVNYLRAYDTKRSTCKDIITKIVRYDFSSIKGALISSVPGRHTVTQSVSSTDFGWAAMKSALTAVPLNNNGSKPEIAIQISSIATLGPTDSWLKNTFFRALSTNTPAEFKVVFPTPDEIRKSLDGYNSGGSIHTKVQSPQQAKQLQYLKPLFHHWANDSASGFAVDPSKVKDSGRKRAAPHIKTYIRSHRPTPESNESDIHIDWALLTSANLSKQAWGEALSTKEKTVRISSYEIGVLVWPGLYDEKAVMRPAFLSDTLLASEENIAGVSDDGNGKEKETDDDQNKAAEVALRMPYNLPLQRYGPGEVPWVATANHTEPDWMGRIWQV